MARAKAGGAVQRRKVDVGDGEVVRLDARPAALPDALAALRAARIALVAARAADARREMGWWLGVGLGLLAIAALAGLAGAAGRGEFLAPIAIIGGFVGVIAVGGGLRLIPRALAIDPWKRWLAELDAFLAAVRDDLHPDLPLTLRLDLRDMTNTPTYRTGTSPHSGAEKRWHRATRLDLRLVLADGTLLAWQGIEKAKLKAGSYVWRRGITRIRVEALAGAALPASAPRGFKADQAPRARLFWRKSSRFDEALPDLDLLRRKPR